MVRSKSGCKFDGLAHVSGREGVVAPPRRILSAVTSAAERGSRPAPTLEMLRAHRAEIERLATARGASNIRVFGSVARGDAGPESDIDLIVDFTPRHSGLDLVALAEELEQLLGYRVEVGTRVHSSIRDRVERQLVAL